MENKKITIVLSVLLIAFGIIFSLSPHEVHELLTFGANIPHFLHFVMGFVIVSTGLFFIGYSIKKSTFKIKFPKFAEQKAILIKIKIPLIILFLILGFFLFKLPNDGKVIAQESPEYQKLKQIAKDYCSEPNTDDPQCLKSFQEAKSSHFQRLQAIAQEQFGVIGNYTTKDFDPMEYLSTWNFNNLPEEERKKYYKETKLSDGKSLREYWIFAEDREIEIAPGVFFPAWTYNGQVPGPTIRATEGDLIKIHFTNKGTKPHTMHFHGFHTAEMDGAMTQDFVYPGQSFTYEFEVEPFGVHLYHCHSVPIKQHLSKGLYGAYIVDPKNDTRAEADRELVMIMNAFDTNFDEENEVYAVNSKAFYYALNPIKVKKDELIRIYLINLVEFDPINSFHVHATFFDEYKTGTKLVPNAYTDIVSMAQAERSILDVRFKFPGMYMFHAHISEFTELGWMGFFEVE